MENLQKYFIQTTPSQFLEAEEEFENFITANTNNVFLEYPFIEDLVFLDNGSDCSDYFLTDNEVKSVKDLMLELTKIKSYELIYFTENFPDADYLAKRRQKIEDLLGYEVPTRMVALAEIKCKTILYLSRPEETISVTTVNENFSDGAFSALIEYRCPEEKMLQIFKTENDWFWVYNFGRDYYRCDGIKGLVKLIEWL